MQTNLTRLMLKLAKNPIAVAMGSWLDDSYCASGSERDYWSGQLPLYARHWSDDLYLLRFGILFYLEFIFPIIVQSLCTDFHTFWVIACGLNNLKIHISMVNCQ